MSTPNIMPSADFVVSLNAVIKKCRDILRLEGITGMDSMKHLTLYTLIRRLDEGECTKLKIPTKFSWEKFIEFKNNNDDHQRSYNLLYCANGATEDLISCIDKHFGTKNFNFKLKNPTNHVDILNEFKKLDFSNLDGKVDILGTIYEIHLGSGSNKSAMRDLGQFFTERDVCKYMTHLCNPKILPDGRAESVLDPTMGTGGFLSSYIQHLGNSVDWSKMDNDIAGYDIDEFVMSIGKINLYLQTGKLFERIDHRDTLSNDIGTETQRKKFKIILANMPFGVKGLTHAGCCKRVRDIKIQGTKSEPLFLQLMMASLDEGGRCAVVVPDGVLVNSSTCHNGTRKYLLEHFELKRVIKMKGQFFSNTGIQPSILFFENTGKPTKSTEFWEVEKNSAGVITEAMIVSVPLEKIDTDSYSLDMRRYMEVVVSEKASTFPMVKLGEIVKFVNGYAFKSDEFIDTGIPVVKIKNIKNNRLDFDNVVYVKENDKLTNFIVKNTDMVISLTGELSGDVGINTTNIKCYLNQRTARIDITSTNVIKKYIYYYTINNKFVSEVRSLSTGSAQPNVSTKDIENILIPLPPLETQQQIVAELDTIYDNSQKASQMAASIKTQMASVMKSVGTRGYERKSILDLVDIEGGDYITKKDETSGKYPVYGGGGASYHINRYNREPTCVINKDGMSEKCVQIVNEKFFLNHHGWTLKVNSNDIIEKFLHWQLYFRTNEIYALATGSCQKGLNQKEFVKLSIYLPPLEFQETVVARMESLQSTAKMLEQHASSAEENAKFVLDGYLKN